MKKNKKFLTLIMALLLISAMIMCLSACVDPKPNDGTDDDEDIPVKDMLINNGTFYNSKNSSSSSKYIKEVISGWSKNSGAVSYSDSLMGGVDLSTEEFNKNSNSVKENWSNPGLAPNTPKDGDGKIEDTNALLVANNDKAGSIYYRTSSSVSLEPNKYYQLSIDIYTDLEGDLNAYQGVYVFVTDGVYKEYKAIRTDKAWTTITLFIESNNFESRSINIELWLGHGPQHIGDAKTENVNPRLTKGLALFDNIILKEVEATDYNSVTIIPNKVYKESIIYADKDFTYESKYSSTTTSSYTTKPYYGTKSGTPNNYNLIVGKDDVENSEDKPSVITGSTGTQGIFDMSKFYTHKPTAEKEEEKWVDNFKTLNSSFIAPNREDFYKDDGTVDIKGRSSLAEFEAMMIFHRSLSAAGYKSNQKFLIESNKYYIISVNAYVYVPEYPETISLPYSETTINNIKTELQTYENNITAKQTEIDALELSDPEYATKLATLTAALEEFKRNRENKQKTLDSYLADNQKKQDAFDADKAAYDKMRENAFAHFKLTGASVDNANLEIKKTNGLNTWQTLTYYVRGNELSDRYVNLEFWFGEGLIGSDTLMAGGAMFDNITVKAVTSLNDSSLTEAEKVAPYAILSPLNDDSRNVAGLLNPQTNVYEKIAAEDKRWKYSFEDSRTISTSAEAGIVKGSVVNNQEAWEASYPNIAWPNTLEVTHKGEKTPYNVLMVNNKEYTATRTEFTNQLLLNSAAPEEGYYNHYLGEIKPNSFYRLSLWVKTEGIETGKGLTINVLRKNDIDEERNVITSVTNLNTNSKKKNEWQEVVFYLKGSSIGTNKVTFELQLGSGDVLSPDSHIKGIAFVTGITLQDNVTYTEFKGVSTGDRTKTYSFTTETPTTDIITNGNFVNTDYEATSKKDEKAYDGNGNLVGVAVPTSFSVSSPLTTLKTPTNVKLETVTIESVSKHKLTWDAVTNAKGYEIYLDNYTDKNTSKKVSNTLIAKVSTNSYILEDNANHPYIQGSLKVKAVTNDLATDEKVYGVSELSSAVTNFVNATANQTVTPIDKLESYFGVIDYQNYNNYAKIGTTKEAMYPTSSENLQYLSARSSNLLMLHSDYYTRGGYTMTSSQSLDSNSYYEISVWVKTLGDAKASFTVSNQSNIFAKTNYEGENYAKDGNYVGYVNQSTNGEWVQYRFYAETSVISSSLKLEFMLGNKYSIDDVVKDADGKETSRTKTGLSKGTVFFDDVQFTKLATKEAYQAKMTDKIENQLLESDNIFANQYIYKKLIYTTDSFDQYTKANDDSLNGHTPKEYSHAKATDGEDSDSARVYGVYDVNDTSTEKLAHILTGGELLDDNTWLIGENGIFNIDDLKKFMTGIGNNVLFMANLKDNGQYYKSNSYTFNSATYYKISFLAKTKLPDGKYAEFHLEYGDDNTKYTTIKINSDNIATENKDANGFVTYEMYIFNDRTASVSSNKISYHLGTNTTAEDKGSKDFFKGLMAIDNVSIEIVEKSAYDNATERYNALSDEAKDKATSKFYKYERQTETPDEGETTPSTSISSEIWLLITSAIIGVMLIVVIIVMTVRKYKKKYGRKPKVKSNVSKDPYIKSDVKSKDETIDHSEYDEN